MKKLYFVGLIASLFLAVSCEEEDELTPSGNEREWMIITEPENDDPVDWLRYEIYRDYGVSTYYNDTIGSEERVDMTGTTYTYYERLKVFYAPGAGNSTYSSGTFALVKDHLTLQPVLESFRDDVFARFEKGTRFPAFLFVDSIWYVDSWYGTNVRIDSYYGYNTMAVTLDSLERYGLADFTHKTLVTYLEGCLSSSTHSEWRQDFLRLSTSLNPDCQFMYSQSETYGTTFEEAFMGTSFTQKEELGFIVTLPNDENATPTEALDVKSYIDAVISRTPADFEAEYGQYGVVMEKFNMMRSQLRVLGYKVSE